MIQISILAAWALLVGTGEPRELREPAVGSTREVVSSAPRTLDHDPGLRPARLDTLGADAFLDPEAAALIERAREGRSGRYEGLESYEASAWERFEVGLGGSRLRRERTLWVEERAARVRWDVSGERTIRWEGARRSSPVAGLHSDTNAEMAADLLRHLQGLTSGPSPIFHRPGDDPLPLGGGQPALHPLADTAHYHYRYRSGDTIQVILPPDGRRVSLVEVRVEPRRSHFRLIAGSLWFDQESAELVRASYRPARPFILAVDADTPSDVPTLFRSIEAEVRQVTVDYSFHDLQWWLPYRFALTFEVRAGQWLRVPVTAEWEVGDYQVNAAPSPDLDPPELPEGWGRQVHMRRPLEEGGDSVRVVVVVPPAAILHRSPALTTAEGDEVAWEIPRGFDDAELRRMREELDRLLPPSTIFTPRLMWGLEDGLTRYNRVEGLSLGVAGVAPVPLRRSGLSLRAEARIGTADRAPGGELALRWGGDDRRREMAVYRRLAHTSDWDDPLGLSASLSGLISGRDQGEYYRALGAELTRLHRGAHGRVEARLFTERHDAVERNTSFHLTGLFNADTLRVNIAADEGTWHGGSLEARGFRGLSPTGLRSFGALRAEVASGEPGWYQRLAASTGLAYPIGRTDLGLEVGAGAGWGHLPVQRHFYLGGPATLRGIRPQSVRGESHWFARGEVSRGRPAARGVVFGDLGWAGPRGDWGTGRPVRTLGVGLSVLDGMMRGDVARSLGPDGTWRFHVYLDGIL
jgi:hypothetical protein